MLQAFLSIAFHFWQKIIASHFFPFDLVFIEIAEIFSTLAIDNWIKTQLLTVKRQSIFN